MRGCALAALTQLASWLLAVAGVMLFLDWRYGQGPTQTLGIGLFAGTAAWAAGNCWLTAGQAVWRRARLEAARTGARPVDGRQSVLAGRLRPLGAPLVAPLDGAACVCYGYKIYEDRGSGKKRHLATWYEGVGLTPAAIETQGGAFKLLAVPEPEGEAFERLAVPELEGGPSSPSGESARRRAASYVAGTQFAPRSAGLRELEARWNDADGAFRSDLSSVTDETVDLARCTLAQWRVAPGAEVCVFGLYSESRGGIVASPDWKPTQLMLGDSRLVSRALRSRAITLAVVGSVLAAGAAGLVAAFVSSLPAAP